MELAEAPAPVPDEDGLDERGVALHLPRLLAGVVSGALTGIFALGTCTVALTCASSFRLPFALLLAVLRSSSIDVGSVWCVRACAAYVRV
jgi:hypothetical protein